MEDREQSSPADCLSQDETEDGAPSFVVLNARAKTPPFARPLLIIRTPDGAIEIPREPNAWAQDLLSSRIVNVHAALRVIGRLYQFAAIYFRQFRLAADEIQMVVWNYISFRVGDRLGDETDGATSLPWLPVRKSTAEAEFETIIDYLRFCHTRYGTIPLLPLRGRLQTLPDFSYSGKRDFMRHLRGHRERRRKLMGEISGHARPRIVERASPLPRRSSAGQTMPREEIDLIIRGERNPTFKAMWILLAYGGIRISEALNLWCVDVMPGSMMSQFFNGDSQGTPLVILAHPQHSLYTGDFRKTSQRRIDYLWQKYRLVPRPNYPAKHPLRAGWKGMMETNTDLHVSWIYWSFPRPAHAFLQEIAKVLAMRRHFAAAQQHPYLFVNSSDRTSLGEPQKYSNLSKAFDRACLRVGLEPHVSGRHVHGCRHFFKHTLENVLKIPEHYIQAMMRHKSIASQKFYAPGHTLEMRNALEAAYLRVEAE